MNREDIIRMAAEVWNSGSFFPIPSSDDIERFAALVAAHEREACAKLCLEEAPSLDGQLCAEAIRARGGE